MVARYSGAGLGLLAFAVTVVGGLVAGNPVTVTLSRSILALFLFCGVGLALGAVAQMVVAEHERKRETMIRDEHAAATADLTKRSEEAATQQEGTTA